MGGVDGGSRGRELGMDGSDGDSIPWYVPHTEPTVKVLLAGETYLFESSRGPVPEEHTAQHGHQERDHKRSGEALSCPRRDEPGGQKRRSLVIGGRSTDRGFCVEQGVITVCLSLGMFER
jgi:hypothetical protein